MVLAEECQVGEGGLSAVGPMLFVMSVAPPCRSVAAGGVLAVTVMDVEGAARGGGDGPGSPADVEDLGVGSEDDAADGAVTGILRASEGCWPCSANYPEQASGSLIDCVVPSARSSANTSQKRHSEAPRLSKGR